MPMPRKPRAGIVAAGMLAALAIAGSSRAQAQAQGLGGFGANPPSMSSGGMGANASLVIPFAGMYRGFMPSRMGGSESIRLSSRAVEMPATPRRPLILAGTGMGDGPTTPGTGMGMQKSDRVLVPSSFGPRLGPVPMGTGAGRGAGSMGVMPPSFGSPFRPPTIFSTAAAGPGMAM